MNDRDSILQVLDLARWAPSGDNTQPWRFEIAGHRHVVVHAFDLPEPNVYELDGFAPRLSAGALLETIAVAARAHGWHADIRRREATPAHRACFDIRFAPSGLPHDPLADHIRRRAVQRRPMSTQPLTLFEKHRLEKAAGPGYRILWLETWPQRWRAALLAFHSAHLRLTLPEAYAVHRQVIEWGASESIDRIPDRALGIGPLTIGIMRFVLQRWERVRFFNRFMAGTWMPRLQMDLWPGLACGAHIVVLRDTPPDGVDDEVEAGRVVQRLWLTLTQLGLWQQPEMTPIVFSRFSKAALRFSQDAAKLREACGVRRQFEELIGSDCGHAVWMGRVGNGPAPTARATRLPLERLWSARAASTRPSRPESSAASA